MNVEKINNRGEKCRILVAPLDWGLGHATRCIPLIKLLIESGAEVVLAADRAVAGLLKKEFPELEILSLKGYHIHYAGKRIFFWVNMVLQLPKVLATISYEEKWLDEAIKQHRIDAVITDNRFGLHSTKIPCVFITHQLYIQTGNYFLNTLAQKINYRYINRFTACWVPDVNSANNMAGLLSRPNKIPKIPVSYLGILSRCEKKEIQKDIDLLLILSGPEPQRTIFENILLKQLEVFKGVVLMLRGLPTATDNIRSKNNQVTIVNHLPAVELNKQVQSAKIIIARAGYSTIMDLVKLQQKAMLVPTPGQAEQTYLAKYLKEKKMFFSTEQENFSLKESMADMQLFEFSTRTIPPLMNKEIVVKWLNDLQLNKAPGNFRH